MFILVFSVTAGTFLHGQKHALVGQKMQHKKSFFLTFFSGGVAGIVPTRPFI
tara:strand:- start:116 stop:271 length:156 start_codon:yes stop_codon:yes gene_type:complete